MFADHLLERSGIGHRNHHGGVGHLHRRCIGVAVDSHHAAAQSLRCDGHLFAEFAAAKQQQGGGQMGAGHEAMGW